MSDAQQSGQLKWNKWTVLIFLLLIGISWAVRNFETESESTSAEGQPSTTAVEVGTENRTHPETQKSEPVVDLTEALSAVSVEQENADEVESESATEDAQPELGRLKEVGKKTFVSTAGLKYGPGSADGHRLLHVMKHAQDDLEKPIHGVFEGSKEEILAIIDEAWLLVKEKSKQVKTEEQGGRQVFTVDLKRRVGYTGGEVGERKNHPVCTKVRIVIEDENEVVSAYPTDR